MTKVFQGAMLLVGGVALFLLGWYSGRQVSFPSVGELSGIDRKATYDRAEYRLRYPTSWKVVELAQAEATDSSGPIPTHHVAFNRQTTQGTSTTNDCTLEVRTYQGPASPSLKDWAKTVLGVTNPAFGGEVTFEETSVGGKSGLQTQGGLDLFVENSGKVFYLTAGTKLAEQVSKEAGASCKEAVNSMLRSFALK